MKSGSKKKSRKDKGLNSRKTFSEKQKLALPEKMIDRLSESKSTF